MELPAPSKNQPFCKISALEGGEFNIPLEFVISNSAPGVVEVQPALCFLIQHSNKAEKIMFDLGMRRDDTSQPPALQKALSNPLFSHRVPQGCVESLALGNLTPSDIDIVILSHLHCDHVGDTRVFRRSKFVVGNGCHKLLEKCYPEDPESIYASDLLPHDRTRFLPPADSDVVEGWKAIGPFPHAYDFYEDGSLYIIDSPGHLIGHVNILARTSSDGAWIYLAGDSAHHWNLITGESQIAVGAPWDVKYCAHHDKQKADGHIANIQTLWKMPRVRILLAHDTQWWNANKVGAAFWPGIIPSL